jgi:16S rRNA (adenine(1408)-N(1))-methyltransferase
LAAPFERLHIDVGTGDGRAALALAARDPAALVVGLDAVAAPMARASRRAARPPDRGGRPNVLFVVAAIEEPPDELVGRADLVTVNLPWGSLLRGVLGLEVRATSGLASLVRPGGALTAVVSVEPRDGLGDLLQAAQSDKWLRAAWEKHGFRLAAPERADRPKIAAIGSSWARRLSAPDSASRAFVRLRLIRTADVELE